MPIRWLFAGHASLGIDCVSRPSQKRKALDDGRSVQSQRDGAATEKAAQEGSAYSSCIDASLSAVKNCWCKGGSSDAKAFAFRIRNFPDELFREQT